MEGGMGEGLEGRIMAVWISGRVCYAYTTALFRKHDNPTKWYSLEHCFSRECNYSYITRMLLKAKNVWKIISVIW